MSKTVFSFKLNTKSIIKLVRFNSSIKNLTPNLDNQFIKFKNPLLKLNSIDNIPTITELSNVIRSHATKVYTGPRFILLHKNKIFFRIEFDSTRQHNQTAGTQHCIIPLASKKEKYLLSSSKNKRAFVLSVILEETDILASKKKLLLF